MYMYKDGHKRGMTPDWNRGLHTPHTISNDFELDTRIIIRRAHIAHTNILCISTFIFYIHNNILLTIHNNIMYCIYLYTFFITIYATAVPLGTIRICGNRKK